MPSFSSHPVDPLYGGDYSPEQRSEDSRAHGEAAGAAGGVVVLRDSGEED
jgi:hypothetical protein